MKVFEFAKELNIETLVLMDRIRRWKLPIKSHMADLDAKMIETINNLLEEDSSSGKKKVRKRKAVTKKTTGKKATTKKATTKKATTKKATRKKATTKKATTKKATTKKVAAKATEAVVEKDVKTTVVKQVIRRKAKEVQAIEEARVEAEKEKTAATEAKQEKRENEESADGTKVAHTARRNIRTGFVAVTAPSLGVQDSQKKEDDKKKKKTKEQPKKFFSSSDFRKREVIYQKKSKHSALHGTMKKNIITTPKDSKRVVTMYETLKVSEFAAQMKVKPQQLIKKLIANGVEADVNTELDFETVSLVSSEFKFEARSLHKSLDEVISSVTFGDKSAEKEKRPPIVTVMGHVDHGKTTLLDSLREANVASGESGGITQHIGAYSVKTKKGDIITFIDTPGHEAFTAMRARGANLTDIVILVVAADDGLMPQSIEALNHAKAAKVPILVAVNKIDRPNAAPEKVKQQLSEHEVLPEEWGGDTIFCEVSALQKTGLDELLEQLALIAEVQDLKANTKCSAQGFVIESRMEKGKGTIATLLVKEGVMKKSEAIVAGEVSGKIRFMQNDRGQVVKDVMAGFPVEVIGFSEPPQAGDSFHICKTEEQAQELAKKYKQSQSSGEVENKKLSVEELLKAQGLEKAKELPIILKSDVTGSGEAIKNSLEKLMTDEVKVKVVHAAVGGIVESDILLASTVGGIVLGFNVRPGSGASQLSRQKNVTIKTYKVIYELLDDVKKAMSGLLTPEESEKVLGHVEVRNTFNVSKKGTIAGGFVTDGKFIRNSLVRLLRDGRIVYEGKLGSLKRFKDDAKEVASGYECGLSIENFNDIKIGDVIEAYSIEQIERVLE